MLYDIGIVKRRRIISPNESYFAVPAPVVGPYAGPGDIYGPAIAYWGMRAFSLATVGRNALLVSDSGNTHTQVITTIAGGGLDLATLDAFIASWGAAFITTMYDQSVASGGFDLTVGTRPALNRTSIGSLPGATFAGTQYLQSAAGTCPTSQPYTLSVVAKNTGSAAAALMIDSGTLVELLSNGSAGTPPNTWLAYAGSFYGPSGNATDNAFHAGQALINGGTSNMYVDGSGSIGATGAQTLTASDGFVVGGLAGGGGQLLSGDFLEGGWWSGDKSALFGAMDANQRGTLGGYYPGI